MLSDSSMMIGEGMLGNKESIAGICSSMRGSKGIIIGGDFVSLPSTIVKLCQTKPSNIVFNFLFPDSRNQVNILYPERMHQHGAHRVLN